MNVSKEIIEQAEKLKWFQCVPLGDNYVTKGIVDHCTEEIATNRYGIPLDLSGKTVLDIGAMNGYHSLLAEKRGAKVTAIEPTQGDGDNYKCLQLSVSANNLKTRIVPTSLQSFHSTALPYQYRHDDDGKPYDICFYFGVLYHVHNPIQELQYLSNLTKEYALIETAISQKDFGNNTVWELNHGFDNDPTNYWYPTIHGLFAALKLVGFSQAEVIYNDGIRATVKAIK